MKNAVEFSGVSRHFGLVKAVDQLDLTIEEGSFFAMLGPSGSGKTTCLRLISGFEQPTSGVLRIFGEDVSRTPPHLRNVNTVFQDYALFPHLNVRDNVAYGLMVKGMAKAERLRLADEMLDMVKLGEYGRRKPSELSGGQRQRVALARALVNKPKVLLLDEPLGALDLKLREAMQDELKALQKRLGLTFVFVTHDQHEALSMADHLAVFNAGKIAQIGTPQQIYDHPATKFVADFVGSSNVLSPEVTVKLTGQRRWSSLRPENIHLAQSGPLTGEVKSLRYQGSGTRVLMAAEGVDLAVFIPAGQALPAIGTQHAVTFDRSALNLMEAD